MCTVHDAHFHLWLKVVSLNPGTIQLNGESHCNKFKNKCALFERRDLLTSWLWTWAVGRDRTLVCWPLVFKKWWVLM